MTAHSRFLIYGAYGYTGRLVSQMALERGLSPVLAGRDATRLARLAGKLDAGLEQLEQRVFGLDDDAAMDRALETIDVVLHCAGPFSRTHRPMAEACIRTRTHYLDISGEIPVYQSLAEMDQAATNAGIMLLPGIGFDVVPTDCLAAQLKSRLPTATHLTLAIASFGPARVSRGTVKTFIEGLGRPGLIRKDGKLTPVPHLSASRRIDFGDGPINASRVVIADVFSAYHSTGIPNIETYVAVPFMLRIALKVVRPFSSALVTKPVQRIIDKVVALKGPGPTEEERRNTYTVAWGEVRDGEGRVETELIRLPEAYSFTALSCLAAIEQTCRGNTSPGYQTPSSAFGPDFVQELAAG